VNQEDTERELANAIRQWEIAIEKLERRSNSWRSS
jgi:hypothetical protein